MLYCVGVNHRTGALELRERAAAGMALLSTCHRVELYVDAATPPHFFDGYVYEGVDAARHLCRVATGLEATVLGEAQILGQVGAALRASPNAARTVRHAFRTAIRVGELARKTVWSAHPPASVGSVAADLALQLQPGHTVIVGAGHVARAAARALAPARITFVNRTLERAQRLASRTGGEARALSSLPQVLRAAQAVILATSAPQPIIDLATAAAALATRRLRDILLIDTGVPRNVDPRVALLPRVRLIDMDALGPHVDDLRATRQRDVPKVEAIIEDALAQWTARHESPPTPICIPA